MAITSTQVKALREQTGLGMMQCKKALMETGGDPEKAIEYLRKQGAAVAKNKVGREAKEGKILLSVAESVTAAVEIGCETDFVAASEDFQNFAETMLNLIVETAPKDIEALKMQMVDGKTVAEITTDLIAKLRENISIKQLIIENTGPNEFAQTYSHGGGKIGVIAKLAADDPIEPSEEITTLAKDLAMQVAATSPMALDADGIPDEVVAKEKEIYYELCKKEGKPEQVIEKIVQGRIQKFYTENCLIKQIFVKNTKLTIEKLVEQVGKEKNINKLRIAAFHRLQLGQ